MRRSRRRPRRGTSRLRHTVTSLSYRGKVIVLHYAQGVGFESEVVGDGTIHPGPTRDAAVARAKRVIDAMRGD